MLLKSKQAFLKKHPLEKHSRQQLSGDNASVQGQKCDKGETDQLKNPKYKYVPVVLFDAGRSLIADMHIRTMTCGVERLEILLWDKFLSKIF